MRNYRLSSSVIVTAALLLVASACSHEETALPEDSPDTSGTDGTDGADTGSDTFTFSDTGPGPECQNDTQCEGTFADLGACERAACDLAQNRCIRTTQANGTSCDDGNLCTGADQCSAGECQGVPNPCNDNNPCTNDSCVPETGQCNNEPNSALCNDGNLCTTDDQCTGGVCTGQPNPTCGCETKADCAQFDDADLCNGVLTCIDSQCVPEEGSEVVCDASGAGACEVVSCRPSDGECVTGPAAAGTQCDDGNACTKGDACEAGQCTGETVACDDDNPCTTDSCAPDSGCVYEFNTEPCDDGDLCTIDDVCAEGACTGAENPECSECAETADCAPFEDGDLCNGTLVCDSGKCVVDDASVVECPPSAGGGCEVTACVPTTGQCETNTSLDGADCDDGDACTLNDACKSGACLGTVLPCSDDNPCTDDACDPATGCTFTNNTAECDDGNACTTGDVCAEGVCAGTGDCQCETNADCASFEDDNLCNGSLECVEGQCVVNPGSVIDCSDLAAGPCTEPACVKDTGECVSTNLADSTPCDDGSACTEETFCVGGACIGLKISCDDGNLCTDDSCDVGVGCVYEFNTVPCDDGVECTENDVCEMGSCTGTPSPGCGCETNADCDALEDGNACNGVPICVANKCVVDPDTVVVCDPTGSECSQAQCNPATGACETQNAEDGKPCDDEDACTANDVCGSGVCAGGDAVTCTDDNPCTDDACTPEFGCVFTPNTAACDDGDPCTEGDTCGDGACQPGETNVCGDTCAAGFVLNCGDVDTWGTDLFGATDVIETYSCSEDDYPGPEYAYLFVAPFDGTVTATLSNETSVTDVQILEQSPLGCDSKACMATGFSAASATMTAGTSYYIVVDGFLDETGSYTINVDCTPSTESNCSDGIDEDGDELLDCEDPDCADAPECAPPACEVAWFLGCGTTDSWANYFAGSTDVIDSYEGCNNPFTYGGPEYTYVFDAPADGEYTVTLSDESAFTDVMVLKDEADICSPGQCVSYGLTDATFSALAGERYYVVVDGWNNAEGTFDISISCPQTAGETVCNDGQDNDNDDAVDCLDSDCADLPICEATCDPATDALFACGGSIALSTTDLVQAKNSVATYGCSEGTFGGPEVGALFEAEFTGPVTIEATNAGANLFVMPVDPAGCDPSACLANGTGSVTFDASAGATYVVVVDGGDPAGPVTLSATCTAITEFSCTDGEDNDGDGQVDCADSDCFGSDPACQPACVPDAVPEADLFCPESTDGWNNGDEGSTNVITGYSCNPYTYDGPEYTYEYVATTSGSVTVTLGAEDAETDVLVLEDTGLGCNPASCIAFGLESATFDAVEGTTYYIVVDGFLGATGDYDLSFSCE